MVAQGQWRATRPEVQGHAGIQLNALAGKDISTDPYALCVMNKGNEDERKLVKTRFNALLNADSVEGISKIKKYDESVTGRNWEDFKCFIVDSYPECADYFGTGAGLRLQRMDSDLAKAVMLRFARMGYAYLSAAQGVHAGPPRRRSGQHGQHEGATAGAGQLHRIRKGPQRRNL